MLILPLRATSLHTQFLREVFSLVIIVESFDVNSSDTFSQAIPFICTDTSYGLLEPSHNSQVPQRYQHSWRPPILLPVACYRLLFYSSHPSLVYSDDAHSASPNLKQPLDIAVSPESDPSEERWKRSPTRGKRGCVRDTATPTTVNRR